MTDKEVLAIFAHGLIEQIAIRSMGRCEESDAIGCVIQLDKDKKAYIFRYIFATTEYGLIPIEYDKLEPNSIIHYHNNNDDVVTYAALHGDGIVDADEIELQS